LTKARLISLLVTASVLAMYLAKLKTAGMSGGNYW
jgi:hypothetical protein